MSWIIPGLVLFGLLIWGLSRLARYFRHRSALHQRKLAERIVFIERYRFPIVLRNRLAEALSTLDAAGLDRVLENLRLFFMLVATRPGVTLGMPSRAVDIAWHEFILLTREYTAFCDQAFGGYLHHTPQSGRTFERNAALGETHQAGIAFARSGLGAGVTLALGAGAGAALFELDRALAVPGGYQFQDGDFQRFELARLAQREASGGTSSGGESSTGSGRTTESEASGDGGGDGGGCGGGCGS